MPKVITKTVFILFGASVLFAAVLRGVQLFLLTDASGFILKDASGTVTAFYVLCAAVLALCGIAFSKKLTPTQPFDGRKSKLLFCVCLLAGAAMFYDFVYRCISGYNYFSRNSYIELNYIIPLLLAGVAALFCSVYFIVMGASFATDKYDFRQLKYFHLALVIRFLLVLSTRFTRYDDGFFAEENILLYTVLIFGILFSLVLIGCVDGGTDRVMILCFCALSYSVLSFILSVPKVIAIVFGAQTSNAEFSPISYLFTGVFAAALAFEALRKDRSKEV